MVLFLKTFFIDLIKLYNFMDKEIFISLENVHVEIPVFDAPLRSLRITHQ